MSSYCPLPFNHTAISTQGYYDICCEHPTPKQHLFHLNDGDFDAWQKTKYCQEVKQSFIENQKHAGCSACWKKEQQGRTSYRQRILKEYKILGATEPPQEKLLNIDIAVGNLCNLSCLMCDETSSSKILSENVRLKINQHTQNDFKWDSENFVALSKNLKLKPKVMSLRGGEPLYNKKIFELLQSLDAEHVRDTVLHITTNATVWDQHWADVLSKFRLVRMMFSVDAVGALYNYIRYPGDFCSTELNIKHIITNKNIKPLVHATVQNLNILYLDELIQWCKDIGTHLVLDSINNPNYLHFTNLTPELKSKSIDRLENLIKICPDHLINEVNNYIAVLENSHYDANLWQDFVFHISRRDQIRGNSFREFLY
jgi:MoaA/NifB/PqqE/SkfB family radical SAM enzyme